jgi:type IV pilus assembly protein PilA
MNNVFTAKFLQSLRNKKGNKGFTLIELLVVVIIIGVLAAVALPNLLAQVGKARETEGKNAMGTINRGQQAYHFEAKTFTPDISNAEIAAVDNPLGVAITSQYYEFEVTGGSSASDASVTGTPVAAQADGVRDYAGAIQFDSGTGLYGTVLCQGAAIGTAPTPDATIGTPACTDGTVLK